MLVITILENTTFFDEMWRFLLGIFFSCKQKTNKFQKTGE